MLNRLRPAALDIAAFVFLLVALSSGAGWMLSAALVYAGLIVVMRIATIAARIAPPVSEAPEALFHVLYGASLVASAVAENWTLAAAWAAVWVLSFVSTRRMSAPSAAAAAAAEAASRLSGSAPAARAATGRASTGTGRASTGTGRASTGTGRAATGTAPRVSSGTRRSGAR